MSRSFGRLLTIVTIVTTGALAAACSDVASTNGNSIALTPAFQTVPAGFSSSSNSFDARGDAGLPFYPENIAGTSIGFEDRGGTSGGRDGGDHRGDGDHHDGFGEGGIRGLLMGGGLGREFIGVIGFGRGEGRGPFGVFSLPESCAFDSGTGRVNCPDRTERDLTVKSSFAFQTADGTPQPAFDTLTTNTVNVKIDVSGTKTRREGSTTATVHHVSDRTVSGLAPGKAERTVNGTAEAHEDISGVRDTVKFTATRDAADTTTGLVIPIKEGRPTIPSAGTVIRTMTVSITPEGGATTTHSRREVVTFNGTDVVSVTITQDGTTKDCSITLPDRKLVCQ